MNIGMEIFAGKIKVGDKVNMHECGWKIVKKVIFGFTTNILFEDGTEVSLWDTDRIFVIRETR